jgi:hypothetical protein
MGKNEYPHVVRMTMPNEVRLIQDADLQEQLRSELESTRQEFHLVLEELPAEL